MPASSYHEPVADTPAAPRMPPTRQTPTQPSAPPFRPSGPPERQKRSLDDLRGIRGMGRRQEALRGNLPDDDAEDEAVDVPPFIKRRNM